ncbi:MAG: hypothetical protein IIW11_06470, partial [Bacteroidales bacterium]|nr:hypothetical protein [Bacteroidales bacterium]
CYIGSLIYSTTAGAAVLESTDFSGGRIVLSGNTQTIHYHHKDHLGSVRTITDGSGSTIEQNAYYPFGGRHDFGQIYAQTTANRYKFNGKELQTIGNLDLLDYGARIIDRSLLNPPTKIGKAPTFKSDGTPVEIHHVSQNPEGPFKEMHRNE